MENLLVLVSLFFQLCLRVISAPELSIFLVTEKSTDVVSKSSSGADEMSLPSSLLKLVFTPTTQS